MSPRRRWPLVALLALQSANALASAPTATTTAATGITSSSAILNGSGNPNGEATTGWFRYDTTNPGTCNDTFGTRVPATGGTNLGTGSSAVAYSITTTGLSSGTTYYFCAIVNNASATAFGSVLSFVVPGPPITLTVAATNVTATTAQLNGSANPIAASTTGYFRYSSTDPGACNDTFGTRLPGSGGNSLGAGTSSVDFAQSLSGLSPGNTYYFCAIATNTYGTTFGSVQSFLTPALAPSTFTASATSLSSSGATLNGSAIPNGDNTNGWFRYSASFQSTCTDTFGTRLPASGGTALGSGNSAVTFLQSVTGLLPGTTYWYCAIAQNALGTTFGTVFTFTTQAIAPTVTTLAATSVQPFSATLNGSANPDGGTTTGWFRYSTTSPGTCNDTFGIRAPGSGGSNLGGGNSVVSYSQGIGSLLPTTTYFYCAIAANGVGTVFGGVLSFTTPPAAPSVTTSAVTSLAGTSVTLNGSADPNGDATTGWFRYSTTNPGTCNDTFGTRAPGSGGSALGSGLTYVNYSQAVTGLTMGTVYFYCAIAQNPEGPAFGTVGMFTTFAPPTVTTNSAGSISTNTATLNGSANPNGDVTNGWFRYDTTNPGSCNDTFGTRAPVSTSLPLGSGNGPVFYQQTITGLTPKTTYYFCAIAQNAEGLAFGNVLAFATFDQPTVTTLAASNVLTTSATLNSTVNPNGASTNAWFRYASTDPGSCNNSFGTATSTLFVGSGTTAVSFTSNVGGLQPGTTYYYCILANNAFGASLGSVLTFTTPAGPAQAFTNGVTGLTTTAATLNGQAMPNGAPTTAWFRYDTTNPGSCNDTFGTRAPASGGFSAGSGSSWVSYTQNLTGLNPATTYFFCAIANNSAGTGVGSVQSFTTPSPPTVTTTAASSVGSTSAQLNGSGNPNNATTNAWFRISTTNPGTCDDLFGGRVPATGSINLGSGSTAVGFNQPIGGLSSGTTYYYCAIDNSAYGTAFGAVLSFTTLAAPTVTTLAPSGVTFNTATLNGTGNPNGALSTGWFRLSTTNPVTCNDSFGTRLPFSGGTNLGAGNSAISYNVIAAVSPVTTYYYCAIANNAFGTNFGAVQSFTTPAGAPIVSTVSATITDATSVTLNGNANPQGDATNGWFRYSTVSPGACSDSFGTATTPSSLGSGIAGVPFGKAITGLTTGVTYYFCAIAQNPEGTVFGALQMFVPAAAPIVTTSAATGVTSSAATFNSTVNPNGSGTTAYFRYATTNPGTCNLSFGTPIGGNSLGAGASPLSSPVTASGLQPATTYYYCAVATNSYGTNLGAVLSVTTNPGTPFASTQSATITDATSATLNGTGNPQGDTAIGYFRYSTTSPGSCNDTFGTRAPASGGTSLGSGLGSVSFSTPVSGLSTGVTYYYCAIAQNPEGTGFGGIVSFVPAGAPIATTNPAGVGVTTATLNSTINPEGNGTYGWYRVSLTNPGTCNNSFGSMTAQNFMGVGGTGVSNPINLSGLSPGTTYYYCALANNSYGTSLGAVVSFTTAAGPPTAFTLSATSVTNSSAVLNGQGTTNGGATTGWFRYSTTNPGACNDSFGTRAPASGGSDLGSSGFANYSQPISGLTAATTYYYCAIVQNPVTTSFGSVLSFTTPTAPTAATSAATAIAGTSATFNGSGNPNGGAANGWFRFSATNPGSCDDVFGTATPQQSLGSGTSPVNFSFNWTSLSPGTTYYFCAIVQNPYGTALGSVLSFTTASAPTVTTLAATGVTSSAGTLNGNAIPNGSATSAWFRYSTTNPITCNNSFGTATFATGLGSGNTAQPFSVTVSGLLPGNTYYYCAIANNSVNMSFGSVLNFTTQPLIPSVTTTAASGVTNSNATLNGIANPNGASTTGYFRVDTVNPGGCNDTFGVRAPASGGSLLAAGNGGQSYSQALSGLLPNTTYYYCAIANNSAGTGIGALATFTTLAVPTVTTLAATPVTATTATLNASATPNGSATTGWFRYDTTNPGSCSDSFGTRLPASSGSGLGSGSSPVGYAQGLIALAPATTYYFCAVASNSIGTGLGSVLTFTTPPAAPSVTTLAASGMTGTTATLNASAIPNGDASTGWFRYATTSPGSCNDSFGTRVPASGGTSLGGGTAPAPWSQAITGLTAGTTYFVCALASNSIGSSSGSVVSFVTATPPSVTTSAASGVSGTGATLNGLANPNQAAATGWFRYSTTNPVTCNDTFGTRAPASGGTSLGSGNTAVPYSQALTGLTVATTYYFCALASNSEGTATGAVMSFTTQAAPTVTTTAPSGIANTSATLNGSANPNLAATTGWFRYDATNPGTCNDTFGTRAPVAGINLGTGGAVVTYSVVATGLLQGTTYYYCALASNSQGTGMGAVMSFTTTAAPSVTTSAASAVGSTAATLNGSANPNLAATLGWFRYSTVSPGSCNDTFGTRAPSSGGTPLGSGNSSVPWSQPIAGLAPGTTYFVCAIANNSVGTAFGSVQSFTTLAAPTVTTSGATSVTNNGATLNGSANPRLDATTAWFRYSNVNPGACNDTFGTRAPASGGSSLGSGGLNVPFSQAISGLSPQTTYYFCAIAQNSVGTSLGGVLTLTTTNAPSVSTSPATAVASTGATLNGSANPNLDATTGWFRYDTTNPGSCNDSFGTRAPASGGSSLGSGSAGVPFSQAVSGLTPGTTYYFCAIAQNPVGTTFGLLQSFTTTAAPTVTTFAPSTIGSSSATLPGQANPNLVATTGWFRYSTVNPGTCNDTFGTRAPASGGSSLGAGSSPVGYSQIVGGLAAGTTYYFCAIAQNTVGTAFGSVMSFTTTAIPTVTTSAPTGVTSTNATLNGSANPNQAVATGWFRYSTANPGVCNDSFGFRTPASGGSTLGSGNVPVAYSQSIGGLLAGTTYYVCAIASNNVGTGFGSVITFTTPALPVVTTNSATGVASTSATLNGSANPMFDGTTGWFRYSTVNPGSCSDSFGTRAPSSGGTGLGSGSSAVPYSQALSGLAAATTYYFCAIAQNSVGTSFGGLSSFTTTAAPTVTTSAATLVASTTATLNGSANPNLAPATGWFRYDTTHPGVCTDAFGTRAPASGGTSLGSGATPIAWSQALTGLTPGTTYYFCALASNAVGTQGGTVLSFTTQAAPAVTTSAATGVSNTAATLNGSATPNFSATTGWFRYSTTNPGACSDTFGTRAPASGGSTLGSGGSPVSYTQALSGLQSATTYYFCAIAQNAVGTGLGSVLSFTTTAAPTVTTSAPSSLTSTSATLNGSANPNLAATTGWFRITSINPGSCNDTFGTRVPASGGVSLGSGGTAVPYSQTFSSLAAATTYYVCAIANNPVGTAFGSVVTFTTPAVPIVTTNPAFGVTGTSATLNGAANPRLDATTGWYRYDTSNPGSCNDSFGTRMPASGGANLGAGNTSQPFTQPLTGLTPGTTYYFCAIAQNSVGTSFGGLLSFTTLAAPTVTTSAATSVASTTATLNGSANPNLDATTGWFRYDTANPGACNDSFGVRAPGSGGTSLGSGSSPASYSQALTGLTPGTTYYFCALASNPEGTQVGSVLSFTTTAAPAVTTSAASGVTSTGATLNGAANPNLVTTTGWFRYSTTSPGTCNDTFGTRAPASGGASLGAGGTPVAYSQTVGGLSPATTYFFCALASNPVGTSMGSVLSFTTPASPIVATAPATAITSSGATLNGSATPNFSASTGWFRYSASDPGACDDTFGVRAPASGGSSLGSGSSAVPYSQAVSGLAPGTTYFYCAIAQNAAGTSFGAMVTFTVPAAPVVTSSAATNVAGTSATLNGSANPMFDSTTGWFRYATTNPGSCNDSFGTRAPVAGGSSVGAGGTAAPYSLGITGLAPLTTYYFCAIAGNSVAVSFGAVLTFTTPTAPTVTTSAATNIAGTSATLNGSANPNFSAANGWFRYDTTDPGACNDSFGTRAGAANFGSGSTPVAWSQGLSGLIAGTTYYFCALAQNAVGTSMGAVLSFTTQAAPVVTTTAASSVTPTTATLNGAANPSLAATTGWFRYDTTDPGVCNDSFGTRIGAASLGSGNSATPYSQAVTGLSPGATYYFCALASNPVGTSVGAVLSFTTPGAPAATTSAASNVSSTTATLNGAANPKLDSTTGWFRYSSSDPGACDDSFGTRIGSVSLGAGNTPSSYSQAVTGLQPGTTYFYCAIAQNSVGTSFGAVMSFATHAAPAVTTLAPQAVNNTDATLRGQVNPGLDATTAWFRYSPSDPGSCDDLFGTRAPSSGGAAVGAGGSTVTYSQLVSGLAAGTTYFYCAIAQNPVGTSFGAVMSFTTPNGPLTTTSLPSNVTATAATLNGSASPNLDATNGWFRYSLTNPGACDDTFGTRAPSSGGAGLGAGSLPVAFSEGVTGLLPGTSYYYCAIAANSHGTTFGTVASFTTPLEPAVTTSAATAVSDTGATLNGSANPNGLATTAWFRYDTTDPGSCNDSFGTRSPTASGSDLGSGGSDVAFSNDLTGLATGTTYYYCAIAQSAAGTSFGVVMSFTAVSPSDGGAVDGGDAGADLLQPQPDLTEQADLTPTPDLTPTADLTPAGDLETAPPADMQRDDLGGGDGGSTQADSGILGSPSPGCGCEVGGGGDDGAAARAGLLLLLLLAATAWRRAGRR